MTLAILSKDIDVLGIDKYRDTSPSKPMAFRPSLEMSVNQNSTGTNNNVSVRSIYPLIKDVNGVTTSTDSFLMTTKFSALQHVTNDVERAEIYDDHLEFLTKARTAILFGELPKVAITFA